MNISKYFKVKYILPMVVLGSIGLSSCENFLDINTDPNEPTTAPPNLILPSAQVTTGFVLGNEVQRITSSLMQYIAGGNAGSILNYDIYEVDGSEINNSWRFDMYAGAIKDYDEIIQRGEPINEFGYVGIAKISKAYLFSVMTDLWGDIPYTQALQSSANLAPAFDPQEQIYADLLKQLDEGIEDLAKTPTTKPPYATDVIYNGDLAKWKRFANTIKLKLYVQQRKRKAEESKAGINAIITSGDYIKANADDYQVNFAAGANYQNPFYQYAYLNREGEISISQRFIDSLNAFQDPRIAYYLNSNNQKDAAGKPLYRGYENGSNFAPPTVTTRARLGVYALGATTNTPDATPNGSAPIRLVTNFQRAFYLAEAALTLGTTGNAKEYLVEGMRASMTKVGVPTAQADVYITARTAAYDAATTNEKRLSIIMREKWAANFLIGHEAFNDYRRTGYPRLAPAANAQGPNGQILRRLPYAAQELSANPSAPQGVLNNQRVWWDVE